MRIQRILGDGFKGREYKLITKMDNIDEINEDNYILCDEDTCECEEGQVKLILLDGGEPITLEMLKEKRIELEEKKRFVLLRELRDKLLAETDYLMNPDYPHKTEEKKQAWKDYRQALRDLPNNSDPKLNEKGELDMDSITIPIKPY
jgi:hypothetical protein